ncbi:MAG: glycosyltransferase 87 family protein [Terracidiphilus sp.]
MTKARAAILLLLSMSSALSVFWGFALERAAQGIIVDFKVVFYGARCLLEKHDPYDEHQLMSVYLAEGGKLPLSQAELNRVRQVVALQVYLPTAFIYVAPFALLPWAAAHLLWSCLTVAGFTVASFLVWTLAQDLAPGATFYLLCFVLANCGILYSGGNPAGLAISLCVIGVWCFLEDKYAYIGICCFAVSLALKLHDTAFVWFYFLLAGGLLRKRALQTLSTTVAMAIPAILWISYVSPHWIQELFGNISATAVRGGITDPGPSGMSARSGGMIIDLQTAISVFRDDPRLYNLVAYLVFGSLLLVWTVVTLRTRSTRSDHYFALAAIAALSMLPVYHRPNDAKLLVLTLPACATLLKEGGAIGRIALLLNSTAIILTSDLPLAMLVRLTTNLHSVNSGSPKIVTVLLSCPIPLMLLVLGTFYLWVYARRSFSGLSIVAREFDKVVAS